MSQDSKNSFCSKSSTQGCNTKSINPARNWCFTYNNHTSEVISSICSNCSILCTKYVFQEERGENGTPHLQGFLQFKTKRRPFSVFKDKRFHWEITRSVPASIKYCSDRSKRHGSIYTMGIRELQLQTVNTIDRSKFYKWQDKVLGYLDDTSERNIYWIYEHAGGVGKSSLVKYLCVHHGCMLISGKGNDIKYGVVKYFERHGQYPKYILCDIPRSLQEYVSYAAIEEIKNGCFFSGKYESDMCIFNSPAVICFANERPLVDKMSKDRWKIYRIVDKDLIFEFA